MGRKIPGKKHRKIKDPSVQRRKRDDSLKGKINNPPPQGYEQETPKSLLRVMELKKKLKEKPIKKKHKKKSNLLSVAKMLDKDKFQRGMKKPDKYIPQLVQRPTEKPERFLWRVTNMTQKFLKETQFEEKFAVEIVKNPKTGQVVEVKKDKGDAALGKKSQSKKKHSREKKKEKQMRLKELAENNTKDFSQYKDIVEFGETVHRPPINLPSIKTKNKVQEAPQKPGRKGLLLTDLLSSNNSTNSKNKTTALEKERAEKERLFIVDAYRKSKADRS